MSRVFHPVKTKFLHVRRSRRRIFAAFAGGCPVVASPSAKLVARPVDRLHGRVRAPGDKSISHRALILGALAVGETAVARLLEGEDVLRTAAALRALGAAVTQSATSPVARARSRRRRRHEPADVLDVGNCRHPARAPCWGCSPPTA